MFRKKEEKRRTNHDRSGGLAQYGLFDIPTADNFGDPDGTGGVDDDDDDADLEAELLALTSGNAPARPKRGRAPPKVDLDAMVAESMKDVPSDEEMSGDENDPGLLEELSALHEEEVEEALPAATPASVPLVPAPVIQPTSAGGSLVTQLEERLKMYQQAESNAKASGESSRARRFSRGIKTLSDQLKAAKAGRVVNEEDIPPPVAVTISKKPPAEPSDEQGQNDALDTPTMPSRPAPPPPEPTQPPFGVPLPGLTSDKPEAEEPEPTDVTSEELVVDSSLLNMLISRRDQYKQAALQAKREGDATLAVKYVRIAKQFEPVITAVKNGQPVDLSQMPPPPSSISESVTASADDRRIESGETQGSGPNQEPGPVEAQPEEIPPDDPSLYDAPPPPTTVLEALEQRLTKYRSVEQSAKEEGNGSKARRMGRIVKQYETAIKQHKAGKPVDFEDLPTPPGFAPIPQEGGGSAPTGAPATAAASSSPPAALKPAPPRSPVPPPRAAPIARSEEPDTPPDHEDSMGIPSPSKKSNVRKGPQSRQEKQLAFLIARQKEFKEAALQAKKNGELNQAKEYLRLAKGFDPLIDASNSGLPVDMATVPIPPDTKVVLESDFDFITVDDCIPGSDAEIFEKLEEDLFKQAKMCLTTRDHFKAIGDVASANRFEQLALHSKKDLDAVRCAHKRSEPIPKFHYETKVFSIVQCCTDLGDNDLELTIVRGINYTVPNPKEVDTYVKFEFPYPSEDPPKDRTAVIKDTNNPEYNTTFTLPIQRSVRACQRVFKRQGVKLEVWSRGSFFRSDALIGTAVVKLLPLETKCVLHDAFDLLDGRKPVGGKLEVKIRIRNPILIKQVEQVHEKWLIIDKF